MHDYKYLERGRIFFLVWIGDRACTHVRFLEAKKCVVSIMISNIAISLHVDIFGLYLT